MLTTTWLAPTPRSVPPTAETVMPGLEDRLDQGKLLIGSIAAAALAAGDDFDVGGITHTLSPKPVTCSNLRRNIDPRAVHQVR